MNLAYLSSVAWGWTPDPMDMPSDDILFGIVDEVAALGFTGIDFLGQRDSMRSYFTDDAVARLRDRVESRGLRVTTFVSSTPDITDPSDAERARVFEDFGRAVRICAGLGCRHLNMTIPGPAGVGRAPRSGDADKQSLVYPAGYSYAEDWRRFTEAIRRCVDMAESAGLRLSLETFAGTMASVAHGWLRLFDAVDSPNLGIQLDTSHLVAQRQDVCTAVMMIGGDRIFNLHLKDNDGMTRGNLPPGSGIVDYPELFRALDLAGYRGGASIEVEFTKNPRRYVAQGKEHIDKVLRGAY